MNKAITLLVLCFVAAIQGQIALQVTNALIANTNITNVINNGGYGNYGITAPPACGTTSYPSGFTGNLTICYATTLAFPYRNVQTQQGFEVDVTANWNALLQAQYPGSYVNFVQITPTSSGLFPAVQAALNAGTCLVALTSLFETSSRDAVATASCAYGITGSDYLVGPAAGGSAINGNLATLNNSAISIAVGSGSASLTYLQSLAIQAQLNQTASTSASLNLTALGLTNVAVGDAPVLLNYAKNVNPTLCNGSPCNVYTLSPPTSRIVAYSLNATSTLPTTAPSSSPTTAPTPAPSTTSTSAPTSAPTNAPATSTTRAATTAHTSAAEVPVAFSVVAAAAAVVALLM